VVEIEKAIVKTLTRRKEKGISISLIKTRTGMPALNIIPPAIKANTISGVITIGDARHTTIVIIEKRDFSTG